MSADDTSSEDRHTPFQCYILFDCIPWQQAAPNCRVKEVVRGQQKIRLVEFQEGFEEDGWCENGHVGYVISGTLDIEFPDMFMKLSAGDGLWIPAGHATRHRAHAVDGPVQLFLVEDTAGPCGDLGKS